MLPVNPSRTWDSLYKSTATGWASSPVPHELADVMADIHMFASTADPHEVFQRCDQLLLNNNSPIMNRCGLNLLMHLVSKRWGELSDENKNSVFNCMACIVASAANMGEWQCKSKTAMIMSCLIEKEGTVAWEKLAFALIAHLKCDETMAEKTILTCLLEAITIPNDGLKDQRTKDMKFQNWDWLPETLFPLLCKYFKKLSSSQGAATQQYYDLVLCIANTAAAYAKFGEVKKLVTVAGGMDLINSCKMLLGYDVFFPAAFAYLSEICLRVKSTDCDDGVLMDLFLSLFDILSFPLDPSHFAFGSRGIVCLTLVSVKEALGPDFEPHRERVTSSLEKLKENGSITNVEYDQLSEKLCDDMID